MPPNGGGQIPETPDELVASAAEYAETVPLEVPLDRVEWRVSKRSKRAAGRINATRRGTTFVGTATISLSWKAYQAEGWDEMKQTIRHELIHLYEYVEDGKSGHGPRFKKLADELDCGVYCDEFVTPRYQLECLGCGRGGGGRHNRSKVVKSPETHNLPACDCDANLRVTDIETGKAWTNWEEFKDANPDADDLQPPYRYSLSCAGCGNLTTTRDKRSRLVKHPEAYGAPNCSCDAHLVVTDHRTGDSWADYDEMQALP